MLYTSPGITAFVLVITAILGLCMGSFINCLAWRMTHGESILKGRSHCTSCGHELSAPDLVPIFSWLFLHGKCRYCGKKIPARYPITEAICGASFVAIVLCYDVSIQSGFYMLLACLLLCLTLTDIDDRIIPNSVIAIGLIARLAYAFFQPDTGLGQRYAIGMSVMNGMESAFAITVPLFLIVFILEQVRDKEMMGGGDLKLIFMMGSWLDWKQDLLLIILACVIGIVIALVTSKGHIDKEAQMPFGPAIAAASMIVLLFGPLVISWYTGLFF